MRVLMHTRPDWRELPGGDFVQIQRWTSWLRELGVAVVLSDEARPDLTGIDLVHLNNLGRAYLLWPTLQHCRRAGVRTILTPLYWPPDEYEERGRPGLLGLVVRLLPRSLRDRLKAAARCLLQSGGESRLLCEVWSGTADRMRRFLAGFDGLIANSHAEVAQLQVLLPDAPPIHVVHSGVDAFYWSEDPQGWALERRPVFPRGAEPVAEQTTAPGCSRDSSPAHAREGILCVARFDPQKGQHRLIRALRPLNVPLTLVGSDNPNYPGYRAYCRKLAGPGVAILDRQDLETLKSLYRRCQVHALCSWYETTGLTGLEAGCSGARVVMTDRGGTHDYGGDRAWYADPADLYSIGRTVEQALEATETPDLHDRVVGRFTWEQSARGLIDVYRAVLEAPWTRRPAA